MLSKNSHQKIPTVWRCLYEIQKQAKLIYGDKNQKVGACPPGGTPVPFPSPSSSLSSMNFLLNSKGPHKTCNRGSNGQQQLVLD